MDLIYAAALLCIPLVMAAHFQWRDTGWAAAWCALFVLAGTFRFLMEALPIQGPYIAYGFTFLLAVCLLCTCKHALHKISWFLILPWVACVLLIGIRSYFPQFDIDSLDYHLSAVQWLSDRATLPKLYQHAEVIKSWYYIVGFEEWLSIPGLAWDLGLTGGLVGGVIKILGLCTLISLIPAAWPLLRYAAAFLLLVDDHFFFSGQSRYVYLNPSLIPLTALMLHLSWRGARGHSQRLWLAWALAGGIASVKYLGLYFLPIPFIASLFRGIPQIPNRLSRWALGSALLLGGSVFGLHYMHTGNPVAPVPNRFFILDPFYRGTEVFLHYFMQESFWQACSQPLRRLIYPGNWAMKAVAVLILPSFLLLGIRFFSKLQRRLRVSQRRLDFAVLSFLIVQAWAILAHYIASIEKSRYPRYTMGIAILGLLSGLIAFRKTLRFNVPRPFQVVLGWGSFLFLLITLDTRFYNIAPPQRPDWAHLKAFAIAKLNGQRKSLEFDAPYLKDLLLHEIQTDFPLLRERLRELEKESGVQASLGEGVACQGSFGTWPNALFAQRTIVLSIPEGGGYLRFANGRQGLWDAGIRYLILPPDFISGGEKGPFVRRGDGLLEPVLFYSKPLFQGQFLKLVRLARNS